MEREELKSRLGFILVSAGCAIGLGNIWKFPYMVGEYGGGAFVLTYLVFLVILGIPLMCIEVTLGRGSRSSPIKMYYVLEKKGSKWHHFGYVNMIGLCLLMSFYVVVTAWLLINLVESASGVFIGMDSKEIHDSFQNMIADPILCMGVVAIVVIIGTLISSLGIQNGLERISKPMMLVMFAIMIGLAIYSLTLPGAMEGVEYYLVPDFDRMVDQGIGKVVVAAMSQAFFTLSIGLGSMATFGSYANKDRALIGECTTIAALGVFVSIFAGLIIFPACFTYGVGVDSGPSLIFETLPNVFNDMAYGVVVGTLFFLFMSFAALTTVFAVFESIVTNVMDYTGLDRKKSCIINGLLIMIVATPCTLAFGVFAGFQPLGFGSTIMDLEDMVLTVILLPLCALVMVVFCVTKYGWGWDNFLEEVNTGTGWKIRSWMRPYFVYCIPLIIVMIMIMGFIV